MFIPETRNVILPAVMATLLTVSMPAFADTLTYRNDRFGTSVTFPAELFAERLEPPQNGDGMTWVSDDGASLAVYAFNNALDASPEQLADQASERDEPGFEVTYRRVAKDWVVLSGFDAGAIFYTRFEFGADNVIHGMLLKYPPSERATYDALTGVIAGSLEGP